MFDGEIPPCATCPGMRGGEWLQRCSLGHGHLGLPVQPVHYMQQLEEDEEPANKHAIARAHAHVPSSGWTGEVLRVLARVPLNVVGKLQRSDATVEGEFQRVFFVPARDLRR